MNDIYKTNIKTKLDNAMEKEGLRPSEVAHIFGFHANYISMIRNPETWVKCPKSAFEAVSAWINTGQGLKEYSEKHGRVYPEKHEPKPGTVISRVIETKPINSEPLVKAKPEALERRRTEIESCNGLLVEEPMNKKIIIDIEINLIINGRKIQIA